MYIYFLIGFISDLILNYLSRQSYAPASIQALQVYFLRRSISNPFVRILVSGINAGLTIVAALLVTEFFANKVFQFSQPQSLKQLGQFLLLAFPVGYAMDYVIYKTEVFGPTLNPFYKIAGVGFWGAMAFIFSILVAYSTFKKGAAKS
jgi:uncharacterized membrane protein